MDVELTELEKLEVTRVDAVSRPANGFPALIMKGVAKAGHGPFTGTHSHPHPAFGSQDGDETHEHSHSHDGDADHGHSHAEKSAFDHAAALELVKAIVGRKVDEGPDIAGGTAVLGQIADLIIAEAQELKSGQAGEISDIQQLACAAEMIWCWRTGEEAVGSGSVMPATALMQSAAIDEARKAAYAARYGEPTDTYTWDAVADKVIEAVIKADMSTKDLNDLPDSAFAYIEPGGTKDSEGKTVPRSKRHFAIHDKAHADNAAARIAQGAKFGEQALPKVKAAQRKFGEDTSKGKLDNRTASVDTETGTAGELATLGKSVEDLTKALAASKEREQALEAELAKVQATPVPGGPMMTAVRQPRAAGTEDHAAKARYYDDMADRVSDPSLADDYRTLAARHKEKITTA
jgi:hypothetical protein